MQLSLEFARIGWPSASGSASSSAVAAFAFACVAGFGYVQHASVSSVASLRKQNQEARDELQRLRGSHKSLQRIISALQTRDDSDVATIVRRLRAIQDPEAVAKQLEGGDVLLQLHVRPETKFRFTFPFLRDMPRALRTPDNVYLKSPLFESAFLAPDHGAVAEAAISKVEQQPQFFRPYAVAQIADLRINAADVSHWTSVSTDNRLMRILLHAYLLTEYQGPRFCSSLLVNAVLAHACFFAEARRLWDMERVEPSSITTVQAGIVMNIVYNVYSMDKVGLSYGTQAVSMAHAMGLFKPADGVTDASTQIVRDFTAWGLYSGISFQCYHLMTSSPLQHEPAAPLPDPDADPAWYGEFLLQYPSNPAILPMNYPRWTKLKYDIWSILRPVADELFNKEERSDPASRQQIFIQAFEKFMVSQHYAGHLSAPDSGDSAAPVSNLRDTVEAQMLRSKISHETIIRLYYLRNGFDGANMLFLHCLAVLSFATLAERQSSENATDLTSQEDTRSTLILAAKGLYDQGKN
ncbi:hypothetical protein PWT90_07884 [Aphanocladium album]|nr:hypothetical protein PWT90_07884 [Aphanocladium album]